jgi:hypothetical protein
MAAAARREIDCNRVRTLETFPQGRRGVQKTGSSAAISALALVHSEADGCQGSIRVAGRDSAGIDSV